jgi:hypothetical protein
MSHTVRKVLWRVALIGAVLVTVSMLITARAVVFRPSTDHPGSTFNRGKNAVWLGIEWVNEPKPEVEIEALANELADLEITYVFAYVSYLKGRSFNDTFAYADDFLRVMRRTQPDLKILAWYGVPMGGEVDLSRPEVRQTIADFSQRLSNFDGLHVNAEILSDSDPYVLQMLEDVRAVMPPGQMLSFTARHINPILPENGAGFGMISAAYQRELAQRIDQLAMMTYDSALTSPYLYEKWTQHQTVWLSRALAQSGIEVLMGVPTSEEWTATHNPFAENMTSGLQGVIAGLNDADAIPGVITGVAIYPAWETDAAEWDIYRTLWLGR